MATLDELALDLSKESLQAQQRTESQLRERAAALLSAASIVAPISALAVSHGPAEVAIPFGGASVAYLLCVRECAAALLPHRLRVGLLGSHVLRPPEFHRADVRQMRLVAVAILDRVYAENQMVLEVGARRIKRAIGLLTVEIVGLGAALIATLLS